jgi:hypothetical protein
MWLGGFGEGFEVPVGELELGVGLSMRCYERRDRRRGVEKD